MIRKTLVMVAALACMAPLFAHEGHDDEEDLNEKQVAQLATKALPSVVQSKKLAASWSKAQQQEVTVQQASGKILWVVAYQNAEAKSASEDMLYLFFDDVGNYVDANHTGKVPTK